MKNTIRKVLHKFGYEMYKYPDACERLEPHLRMLLEKYSVDVVIDVGANEGQFASSIRGIKSQVPIYSIEPNPAVFERLSSNSKGDSNWTVFQYALGSTDGFISLNLSSADDFSSCLAPTAFGMDEFGTALKVTGQINVPMKTLDGLFSSIHAANHISKNILLKIDTQGYDKQVLDGAANTIEDTQIIVTEISLIPIYEGAPLFTEMLGYFEKKGFRLSGFFPVTRDKHARIIEADCVFLREPKIKGASE